MMEKTLYAIGRRLLDQDARNRINEQLAGARKKFSPFLQRIHGRFDARDLLQELERALPARFDALLIHCAWDGLLPMFSDGPLQLLETLRSFVGPKRTLLMPAFTYSVPGADLPAYFRANPRFDARRQPSQMGLLSEIFRRMPGVLRSLHPTHSVCALGPMAEQLTAEHHLGETTFGARSPFARMAEIETVILGLGKPFYRVLTQTHVPEDLLLERFPVQRRFEEVETILVDGSGEHPYRFRIDTTGAERKLHRLPAILGPGELCEWRYHGIPFFHADAGRLTASMCEAALRGKTIYDGPTLA